MDGTDYWLKGTDTRSKGTDNRIKGMDNAVPVQGNGCMVMAKLATNETLRAHLARKGGVRAVIDAMSLQVGRPDGTLDGTLLAATLHAGPKPGLCSRRSQVAEGNSEATSGATDWADPASTTCTVMFS
jgi:hypothetical protein